MFKGRDSKELFRLFIAVILALLLCGAAIIKFVYPSQLLYDFFLAISVVEIVLAIAWPIFWNRWFIWAFMGLIFASWGGYSLYAAIFGLPCKCLGVAITLPRGTSLLVNILIIGLTWIILKGFQLDPKKRRWLIGLSLLFFVIGYVSASFLYDARFLSA
jgi:hypothetical protein